MCHYGCDPAAEDDTGHNALHYALKRGSREMVEDIIDALSEPLRLDFICRTVVRRHLRYNWGYGEKLNIIINQFPKDNVCLLHHINDQIRNFTDYQASVLRVRNSTTNSRSDTLT